MSGALLFGRPHGNQRQHRGPARRQGLHRPPLQLPDLLAAGLSGGKQARCPQGQTLWDAYNRATGFSNKTSSTLHALHRAGMLDGIDHQPCEAGRKYFTAPKAKS